MNTDLLELLSSSLEIKISIVKMTLFTLFTYWITLKITNERIQADTKFKFLIIFLIAPICEILKYRVNFFVSRISLILLVYIVRYSKEKVIKNIFITFIAFGLSYIFMIIAIILYSPIVILGLENNDYISTTMIMIYYFVLAFSFFRINKFKYGFSFLKEEKCNNEINTLIFNINVGTILLLILVYYSCIEIAATIMTIYMVCVVIMIIFIQEAIKIKYKKKQLIEELEETKLELEDKNKQIKEMEEEILSFNKKSHSIAHKQKALEYKLEKLTTNYEISEEIEIQSRIDKIKEELSKNKADVELTKTNISLIDDMFEFLKSECDNNGIELDLKIYKNIYYMINNIISKEELEIIIADHVKNAIIAINHSNNTNKSILVKLGKIDDYYGIYVYDSGVEFSEKILENLGKKAVTTYKNEGGSGMGFLNTFDTLRKYKASLIIEKIGTPSKDNFTKIVKIKFDNKNEYKVV